MAVLVAAEVTVVFAAVAAVHVVVVIIAVAEVRVFAVAVAVVVVVVVLLSVSRSVVLDTNSQLSHQVTHSKDNIDIDLRQNMDNTKSIQTRKPDDTDVKTNPVNWET